MTDPRTTSSRSVSGPDLRQVDRLSNYAIKRLRSVRFEYEHRDSRTGAAQQSYVQNLTRRTIAANVREILTCHPLTADEHVANWIENVIQRERDSYGRSRPSNMTVPSRAA